MPKKQPGFLIALVVGGLVATAFGGADGGIAMVGEIPSALPRFASPTEALGHVAELAPAATAIALVGLLEAISIGRAFAVRRREKFDASKEMVGQGLSNVVGGMFQCFAGSGSFTRSGVNAEADARTPMSGIFASVFLALILLIFSPLIRFIPTPAMVGLILYVAWRLIDFAELRHVVRTSRPETVILLLTLGAGLFIELDFAIYIGVMASFAVFIYEGSQPKTLVSTPTTTASGRRRFRNVDLNKLPECPQILSVHIEGLLYFGSVDRVEADWEKMRECHGSQRHIIFYLKGLGKIDLAGADLLIRLIRDTRAQGGFFHIVALHKPLQESLRRFHVIEEIGEDHLLMSKGDALAATIADIHFDVCRGCKKRVFLECTALPGAK